MAKHKTSVTFDDDTIAILARRTKETQLDRSAYLAELIKRDDLRRRIIVDSATLDAAGYSPERTTTVASAVLAQRQAQG